ncbi:mannose-1-phosphate guanylyltransferase [Arthrobacter bambusae]|uniref:mannose-1-phosphate guanylyltransferase n=1 Tax=Arthrobacter bambusae TaxID=1338426 RepID=UPI0027885F00|nr:sugar phosphate nucleotidyltransferase [Arthrobacter bambusae]MDQ0239518.1 mannose-1-phosphate guanylyltransferase [Arthrobacter bambusae]
MTESLGAYVVILCGGVGTRLWPFSRREFPKYLRSFGGTKSLLDAAIRRALLIVPASRILLVTTVEQSASVSEAASEHGVGGVVVEPSPRGTTAALLLALFRISEDATPEVIVSMPADHLIEDEISWAAAIRTAVAEAADGGIVTLGIVPHRPATEFGYIEMAADRWSPAVPVRRFHEKPDHNTAVEYVKTGAYLWNTAIMAFRHDVARELLERYAPDIVCACRSALVHDADEKRWGVVPSVALEHALMEPAAAESIIRVVPAHFDWRDVGTWDEAVDLIRGTQALKIASEGIVLVGGSHSEYVQRRYVFIGVHDLIIVDDGDVVLVTTRGTSSLMRDLPGALAESDWSDLQ